MGPPRGPDLELVLGVRGESLDAGSLGGLVRGYIKVLVPVSDVEMNSRVPVVVGVRERPREVQPSGGHIGRFEFEIL